MTKIEKRLEYLRGEIKAEKISYGEIAELVSLAKHIDKGDTLLLEWAGVPEFEEADEIITAKLDLGDNKTKTVKVGIDYNTLSELIEDEDTTDTSLADYVSEVTGFAVLEILSIKQLK